MDFDILAFDSELKKEAGDILWQLSGLCKIMGWSLEDVAQMNLDKLAARKAVGTIDGNGMASSEISKETIQLIADHLYNIHRKKGVTCEEFLRGKSDSLTVGNYYDYDQRRHKQHLPQIPPHAQ